MAVLVTYVSIGRHGGAQRDQRRIASAVLDIGRGTHCQIHLADARVALNHARITITAQGASIEAQAGAVEVNGRAAATAALAVGDRIEIGPYDVEVEVPPAGLPLALSVKLGRPLVARGVSLRRMLGRRPPVSKRRLSYIAFVSVLLLCLFVPVGPDLLEQWRAAQAGPPPSESEIEEHVLRTMSGKFTRVWNPGPVSRSHQVFGSDCRACHELPFVQVRDAACLACHKEIREHVARKQLTGPQGLLFAEARCAECHRDHKGMQMAPRAQEQCADCHRDVKALAAQAGSENVTDFHVDHPPFRLSLLDAGTPGVVQRVRQGKPASSVPAENSNLKFNHALHLDREGVRSLGGKRTVLECASCHQPAEGGRLMALVSMEKHCQECHSLAFEPKLTERQVPHGSEDAIATMLREFYARLVLGDAPPGVSPSPDLQRRRPGAVLGYQDRQAALRIADERAQRALRDLFETREVCSTCHYVQRHGGGWKVAPVVLTSHWLPQSKFTHAKHATMSCADCHQVTQSKEARDIAMPDIGKCRECHVGARAVIDKVTSDCTTCHQFHAGRDRWHGSASLISQREAKSRK